MRNSPVSNFMKIQSAVLKLLHAGGKAVVSFAMQECICA